MKGLKLVRANHSATPCAVERRDESKEEDRCGRGQTKRRWDDVNDDDNRDRPRMADDDANDSQALTSGDITRYRALVARISYPSQDRPDLKFASMRGMLCDGKTIDAGHGMRQEDWQVPRRQAKSEVLGSSGNRVVSWRRIRTLTGEVTGPLDHRSQLESS